jgi:hypothetical protein
MRKNKQSINIEMDNLRTIEERIYPGEFRCGWDGFSLTWVVRSTAAPAYKSGNHGYGNADATRNHMLAQLRGSHAKEISEFLVAYGNLAPILVSAAKGETNELDVERFWRFHDKVPALSTSCWTSPGVRQYEKATIYCDGEKIIHVEHANGEPIDAALKFLISTLESARFLVDVVTPLIQAEIEVEGATKPCVVDRRDFKDVHDWGPFKVCERTEEIKAVAAEAYIADFLVPTDGGQRVGYRNGDKYDCRRRNLFVIEDRLPASSLNLTPRTVEAIQHQASLRGKSPEEFLDQLL